jgi:putative tryptophan/tyrosine transport system substrate-binding protein
MRRREFIAGLGGTAALPLVARAQQRAIPAIGLLGTTSPDKSVPWLTGFRQGLKAAGFNEGQNVAIEYRWAEGNYDRLPALAAELVHIPVNVIAAIDGLPSVLAARTSTSTIPIVFLTAADPIQYGFINSFIRPGGNITGVVTLNAELVPKRFELAHEIMPAATTVAFLVNPTSPLSQTMVADALTAGRAIGVRVHTVNASTEDDFDKVFGTLAELRVNVLVIGADPFFNSRSEQLANLALRRGVASIYQYREFAAAGGLMSYGPDSVDQGRQVGIYTGRILNGAKPDELPVQQNTKVELILNLKTASALGLTVPLTLLAVADEVIE